MDVLSRDQFKTRFRKCSADHSHHRNLWLVNLIPELCISCYGLESCLESLRSKLNYTIEKLDNALLRKASLFFPTLHDPENIEYIVTCGKGHSWQTPLRNLMQGESCLRCIIGLSDPMNVITLEASKQGWTLLKLPDDLFSRSFSYIDSRGLVYESSLSGIVYQYRGPEHRIQSSWEEMRRSRISSVPSSEAPDDWVVRTFACSKGHSFEASSRSLRGEQWCPYPACNGKRSLITILKNLAGQVRPYRGSSSDLPFNLDLTDKELEDGDIDCRCCDGHTWNSTVFRVIMGDWCDECLGQNFQSLPDLKALAKSYGCTYKDTKDFPGGQFVCKGNAIIARCVKDLLRRDPCDQHDICKQLQPPASQITQILDKTRHKNITVVRHIEALLILDSEFELSYVQIEDAAHSHYERVTPFIFLLAKYNTPQKVQGLAKSKDGTCLVENCNIAKDKLQWICGKKHFEDKPFSWKERLFPILLGSWCPLCSGDRTIGSSGFVSQGAKAVELYLQFKNWTYEKEKTFPGCVYKKLLRFDFYVPHLNLLIEFDGGQHFRSTEFYGGDEAFKNGQIRDAIKEDYCANSKIRLIRLADHKTINSDLDRYLSSDHNTVMIIENVIKRNGLKGRTIKTINNKYFSIEF